MNLSPQKSKHFKAHHNRRVTNMPDRHGGYSKHMLCFRCGPICSFQIFYVMRLVQFYNQWEMVLNYKPAFHSEKQEATSGWQQKGSHSKIWNKEPHVRGWLKTPRAACFLVNTWVQPHIFCTQEIIYKGLCVWSFSIKVKILIECNVQCLSGPSLWFLHLKVWTWKRTFFFLCEGFVQVQKSRENV